MLQHVASSCNNAPPHCVLSTATHRQANRCAVTRAASNPTNPANQNLGPSCSPDNIDLCDDTQKGEIAKYQAKDQSELQETVDAATKAVEDAEKTFKDEVSKLQAKYEALSKDKDDTVAAAATPELKYVKMVLSSMKKTADAKDEL